MADTGFPIDLNDNEKELVSPFFTNTDKHIFAMRNLPEVIQGTLFSRYSRSDKSARRLLLDEFIPNKEVLEVIEANLPKAGMESSLAVNKAEDFYQRVLVGYGDDSVAELAGCHVACENISSLAGDLLTDSRLGISPLEKSARYIPFDKKVDGKYLWYRPPAIMQSRFADKYARTHDTVFDLYCKWLPVVISYAKEQNPRTEDTTPRAYENAIRAKACDVLKNMLTAGRLTNVGLFGNGRSFEYLLVKLYSSELAEGRGMAVQLHEELAKVMPAFVRRAQASEFLTAARDSVRSFAAGNMASSGASPAEAYVRLVDFDKDADTRILSAMLYPHSTMSIWDIRKAVESMSTEKRRELISAALSKRKSRRDKPGRPFENAYYTFEICSNYGMFRDLHRHRVLTIDKQMLTTSLGFDTPRELEAVGLDKDYMQLMRDVAEVHREIAKQMPIEAQYIVPRSYRMRYYMKMNLREIYHLTELRSIKQGHPDYRKIAQNMKKEVEKVHPSLLEFIQVDMNDYTLARMDSEKRIDQKLSELDKKAAEPQQSGG